ncbi:DUF6221 family protein [Streptomyces sp. enrichment culture]|uniref:DUF6221 family protein n=1 Tax=Streptomyces sp. enrichment culture TaxID=1795815 RepID=UPI003F573418
MSDIADFLRARYAEQRALALAASPGPWQANGEHDEVTAVDGITVAEGFALSGRQLRATVDHIAAHNPAAVLADLDAKRFLIEGCEHALAAAEADPTAEAAKNSTEVVDRLLRYFAAPFAGHPDHKGEEWAP